MSGEVGSKDRGDDQDSCSQKLIVHYGQGDHTVRR
jgi:hypothetical protein